MAEHIIDPSPMAAAELPSLSVYTDFRLYLKDVYLYRRNTLSTAIRPYSYAHFSASADIKSPNYLKLIIDGKRNLSDAMINKFARALQLNKEQTKEFACLVKYGQAKDPLERNRRLKVLSEIRIRQRMDQGEIDQKAWEQVPSWISLALHALLDQEGVDYTEASLREALRGRASNEEIRKALGELLDNGELVQEADGRIQKGRQLMKGASEIPSELVRKLQAELIYLGLESLFQDQPKEREFGAFTMAMTEKEFEQVKFEIRQFRKKLYKDFLVKREQYLGERVYQLNFQLFPVSNPTKK